ncbi:carboxypeptidase regulatory-like domain-containing protein, partial [Nanoarchaeota archaeon]
ESATLSGTVKDGSGNALSATVSWTGPTSGYDLTDSSGAYKAEGLTLNKEYSYTVSSPGYKTETGKVTLKTDLTKHFVLETAKLQGINGYVYIDKNNDGKGTEDEKIYGASIYIDSVFRSYSQYSKLGFYEVSLSAGTYKISASYQTYKLKQPISFTLVAGVPKTQPLILTKYIGECSHGGKTPKKAVTGFSANHVLGKEEVSLKWTKPCPEVTSYQITKTDSTGKKIMIPASPAMFSYTDSKVEWGKSYTYEIVAVYTDVETRYSTPVKVSITLGDKECEDKTIAQQTFCLIGKTERQTVWTCDSKNQKGTAKDCSKLGTSWYCSEISDTSAICKDSGKCGMISQSADPFGMYYDRQTCYGVTDPVKTDPANFCYYDYTDTVVDKCDSCANINSCFSYKGKDACEINNCLGTECNWVDSADGLSIYKGYENILSLPILEETGHGYCAEKDYKKDDKCDLCGPKSPPSTLFENYYCTANICSNLGKCFSEAKLKACLSCGKNPTETNNCYAYGTKQECTGGQPLTNTLGEITLSKDRCEWGRCIWKGTDKFDEHGCIKDGDGNGKEDCSNLLPAEQKLCKIDNNAPETKLVPEGIKIVSFKYPELTFQGTDKDNEMGVLGYCLGSSDKNAAKCSDFKEISYPGKLSIEKIKLDIANKVLKGKVISGKTYRLRYYSKDEYFNQENAKEEFIFVDTEIPQYELKSKNVTSLDKTDLEVYLTGLNELMECTFELKPILPIGTTKTDKILRTVTDKKVSYDDLTGFIYDMNVSCEDDYGNQNNKSKRFVFDLEPDIDVVYPKGPISKMKIAFNVKTTIGSTCELYTVKANQKIADFVTDSTGKEHKTKEISGFIEGDYKGTHKVVCKDLLTQKVKKDYFDFQVDFTGPKTQIILTENKREEKPTSYGWEENFIKDVNVSFKCSSDGFACKKTNYCLGNGCEYVTSTKYKEYTKLIGLSNDTDICYYSSDAGTNDESPICGKIVVDGFGITLVRPKEYSYQGEKWGVSNKPTFDLKIMTKVPTTDCRFDFLDNFKFDYVAPYKIFPKEGSYYTFDGFPGKVISSYSKSGGVKTIYVKCKNSNNEIGPAQKFNLEYDPSAPTIKKAYANPDKIYDGIETNIYAITDDKTICRFGEGKAEFGTMKYSFPGIKNNILYTNHQIKFKISFSGTKKTYKMSAQCKNGAGNLSKIKNFSFTVDYTKKGNIISTKPSGYIDGTSVTLEVVTNKNSQCKYNTTTLVTTDGKTHKHSLGTLTEGKYAYLIR